MQCVRQIQACLTIGYSTFNANTILNAHVTQRQQVVQNRQYLVAGELIVASHDPFELQNHRLADHQFLTGFDQIARGLTLTCCFSILLVLDVIAGKHICIQPDHRLTNDAGSKSTLMDARRLFSMPKPPPGTSFADPLTRIST
jgi:hypothetical protein